MLGEKVMQTHLMPLTKDINDRIIELEARLKVSPEVWQIYREIEELVISELDIWASAAYELGLERGLGIA